MTNVIPLPRSAPPAGGDAPFDEVFPLPREPDPPRDDRRGGGGGGGGKGSKAAPQGEFGPVVPLGTETLRKATAYVFLDAAGKRTTLTASQVLAEAWLVSLFGGEGGRAFLWSEWPRRRQVMEDGKPKVDSDGSPVMITVGFDHKRAGSALIQACTAAGDAGAAELRRDGLWRHSSGAIIHHRGDQVRMDGEDRPPGLRDGRAIYVSAERRDAPADPASVAQAEDLMEALRLWRYADPAAPELLLGMVACGIYGAVLPWRPHMFLLALEGSGKSSLNRFIAAACGAGEPSTDISEPGIRRMFDMRSGLIPLDEFEADAQGVARVVDLMRGASDGRGAIVVRASAEGGGNDVFCIAGCFLFSAITQPRLSVADVSRITQIDLLELTEDRSEDVRAATARAATLHPALLGRLLARWEDYRASYRAARDAIVGLDGTNRNADQLGALVAGWWTLTADLPLTLEAAAELLPRFTGFVTTRAEAAERNTAQRALQHMLASRVPVGMRSGDHMTLQAALQEAWDDTAAYARSRGSTDPSTYELRGKAEAWRKKLGNLGLRLMMGMGTGDSWPGKGPPTPGLWVRNGSPAVEACFSGTPWAGGGWEGLLRRLPGAQISRTSMKFAGGGQDRAGFVALGLLGLEDGEGNAGE